MLKLYRRHLKTCDHRSTTYRRCKCPVWVFGSVDGFRVRKALDTVNWQHAEEMLRELDPHERPTKVSLLETESRFISDYESRKLARETVAKYKLMMAEAKIANAH